MSNPRAKRALDFGPSTMVRPAKRSRRTVAVRRIGMKPEMKHQVFSLSHTSVAGSNLDITNISQGAGSDERVGAKIKSWSIDVLIESAVACKVEVLMPIDNSATAPANLSYELPDRDTYSVLGTYTFNPSVAASQIFQVNHSFPLGVVTRYDDELSSIRNKMYLRVTTPSSATILGRVRLWYTDV